MQNPDTELQLQRVNEEVDELENSPIYDQATKQAAKFMRRNRREWKRLHQHAETALWEGNKEQYCYAIKKMRDMLKQPYNDALIETLWVSNKQALSDLVRDARAKLAS